MWALQRLFTWGTTWRCLAQLTASLCQAGHGRAQEYGPHACCEERLTWGFQSTQGKAKEQVLFWRSPTGEGDRWDEPLSCANGFLRFWLRVGWACICTPRGVFNYLMLVFWTLLKHQEAEAFCYNKQSLENCWGFAPVTLGKTRARGGCSLLGSACFPASPGEGFWRSCLPIAEQPWQHLSSNSCYIFYLNA